MHIALPRLRLIVVLLSCGAVFFLLVIAAVIIGIGLCEVLVRRASADRAYASTETVPYRRVGLVLGCSKHVAGGRVNLYFRHRIAAAAALFKAGKVDYLIVSGDNHRRGYDEPTDMKLALIREGVPEDRIQCDYAGFRTLDSVIRADAVFCASRFTVISQRFHAERAIYLGRRRGLDIIAYTARDVNGAHSVKTAMRERLARVKAVLDVTVLGKQPKFLGPRIPVGRD